MAKITKIIDTINEGSSVQEWFIKVDADRKGLNEVIDVLVINSENGKPVSTTSIMDGLEQFGALDIIVAKYDWALEYAEHMAGENEYNELNY